MESITPVKEAKSLWLAETFEDQLCSNERSESPEPIQIFVNKTHKHPTDIQTDLLYNNFLTQPDNSEHDLLQSQAHSLKPIVFPTSRSKSQIKNREEVKVKTGREGIGNKGNFFLYNP